MKLDPGIHIAMHSILFLKPGVHIYITYVYATIGPHTHYTISLYSSINSTTKQKKAKPRPVHIRRQQLYSKTQALKTTILVDEAIQLYVNNNNLMES